MNQQFKFCWFFEGWFHALFLIEHQVAHACLASTKFKYAKAKLFFAKAFFKNALMFLGCSFTKALAHEFFFNFSKSLKKHLNLLKKRWGKVDEELSQKTICFESTNQTNETSPYPLHKGDDAKVLSYTVPCSWYDYHNEWHAADKHGNKPSTWCTPCPIEAYHLPTEYYAPDSASRTSHKTRKHP